MLSTISFSSKMWFVFTVQLINVLLRFQSVTSNSCDQADWQVSLDRIGWSRCPKDNTYLKGLWRHERKLGDERVGRIEFGKCCPATEPGYANQPATCSNANWQSTLDGWVITNMKITDGEAQLKTLKTWNGPNFYCTFLNAVHSIPIHWYKSTLVLSRMSYWPLYFLSILLYWKLAAHSKGF